MTIVMLVLATLVLSTAAEPASQTVVPLRIGFLEGQGAPGDFGVRLAVSQINATGGITGPDGTRYRLEMVYPRRPPVVAEDIPEALRDLNAQDVIAIIGPVDNRFALPNLEPLARAGVPVLTLASSDTLTDVDVTNNIMRMRAAERYYSRAIADFLVDQQGYTRIAIIQTDVESTEALLIFEQTLREDGLTPTVKIQRLDTSTLEADAAEILQSGSEAVVMWGPPQDAAQLLQILRTANYRGEVVYRDVLEGIQNEQVPLRLAEGVVGVTAWAYTTPGDISRLFLLDYVTAFNAIPGGAEAAAYDALWILRRQIEESGPQMPELYEGLLQTPTVVAVQGRLEPLQYGNGDFARHVSVYEITDLGGPRLLARYANDVQLPDSELQTASEPRIVGMIGTLTFTPSPSAIPTETFTPSATPDRVQIVVNRPIVNVRSGPGTDFEKIGELNQGDRLSVIGSNQDFTWWAIQYRGQTAWVAASVVEVFDPGGMVVSLPIIQPDATSAVVLPPGLTSEPSSPVDLYIENVVLVPAQLVPGQPFTAQVTVRNQGTVGAGGFLVAATFQPGNIPTSAVVNEVVAGGSTVVNLSPLVNGTGAFTVTVIVDSGNSVPESNEGNNLYPLSYRVDFPLLAQVQSLTLPVGLQIDMAGGTNDIGWTGAALEAVNGARLGVITNATFDTIFYDRIDPAALNQTAIGADQLQRGVLLGVITAEGRRAVLRIDRREGDTITVSFRVYNDSP
ncbi:MAG: ABC transporter substrate-binding protein [Chloroflexi bacterium]|nr:ABC transporter substrate-binding protein [Chloroflexota bacterium]